MGGIDLYEYVLNDPLGWVDPSGLNTTVFILYDHGIGSHAAVLVDNGGDPILYDPAGGYGQDHHCNEICNEGSADPNKYKKYHNDKGTDVKVFIFNTTPDQEKQIVQNILDAGSSAPGMCTLGVSGVLSGVGPFKNLGHYLLPGSLGRALGNLQNPPPPYRPGGHFK